MLKFDFDTFFPGHWTEFQAELEQKHTFFMDYRLPAQVFGLLYNQALPHTWHTVSNKHVTFIFF